MSAVRSSISVLSWRVQTTGRERLIAQTTTEGYAWAFALDLGDCVNEVNGIRVVLRKARCNSHYVAVENDVLRKKSIFGRTKL